jgi:molybdate transport system substrate-binding protein
MPLIGVLLSCIFALGCEPQPRREAGQITVAAAADLKFALDEIAAAFQRRRGENVVRITYGSSGKFFAQLSSRAPFDMYLSADVDYPRRLVEAGVAEADQLFHYAVGRIVVWVPNQSKLDLENMGTAAVADGSVKKIAIANPRHAPYGRAAEAALRHLGLYEQVADRLVLGENIAQAAQFVESGAADVGIIAMSLAMSPQMRNRGRWIEVPIDAYPRMDQGGLIVPWASDPDAARAFRDFILSDEGQQILGKYGFLPPAEGSP